MKKNKLWYDIHVTVDASSEQEISAFIKHCQSLKLVVPVKPLVIDLFKDALLIQREVMTSSQLSGNDSEAFLFMNQVAFSLSKVGHSIVRKKIESEPSHPDAPQFLGQKMKADTYFESHDGVIVASYSEESAIKNVARLHGARVSENRSKVHQVRGKKIFLLTLRDHDSPFEIFSKKLEKFRADLISCGTSFYKKKHEVEYAVFDSFPAHDAAWINS